MTRYYRYNWCDMQEIDQIFDLQNVYFYLRSRLQNERLFKRV